MLKISKKMINRNKGDTLVEVLFAVSVFSLVVVGSLSIMNQGSATAERALEITLVRQQIDSQAEALRYLNSSYITAFSLDPSNIPTDTLAGQWVKIKNSLVDSVSGLDDTTCPTSSNIPAKSFILNTKQTTTDSARFNLINGPPSIYEPATTYSQVIYDPTKNNSVAKADCIWIEAIRELDANKINADYIDFHIYACWQSPGQSNPVTIGTIVRLYEPV